MSGRTVDQVINSGTVPIAVRDHGGVGPPVVLLHGLGGNLLNWEVLAPELTARHRMVAVDLRGHGASGDGPWEDGAVLGDVEAVAAHLELDRPAVMGASLGGMLAVLWGLRHPDCPGVVNLDGGHRNVTEPAQYADLDQDWVGEQLATLNGMFTAQTEAMARPLTTEQAEAMADQQRAAATALGVPPDLLAETFRRNLTVRDGQAWIRPSQEILAAFQPALQRWDLLNGYRRMRCPLLLVTATRTPPGQEAFAELMAAYHRGIAQDLAAVAADRPGVRVVQLDASHGMFLEQPKQLAKLVIEFLAGGQA